MHSRLQDHKCPQLQDDHTILEYPVMSVSTDAQLLCDWLTTETSALYISDLTISCELIIGVLTYSFLLYSCARA